MKFTVSDYVARALVYVGALNDAGVKPWTHYVDVYAGESEPSSGRKVPMGQALSTLAGAMDQWLDRYSTYHPAEPVSEYLKTVGWVFEEGGRLELSELGEGVRKALRAALLADADENEIGVRILSPDDPMRYAMLTNHIATAGEGLLVDPYFKEFHVEWLASATTIRRVLVGSKSKPQKDHLPLLAYRLHIVRESGRELEIRHTASGSLHDRGVISATGNVSLLGTSLTGVAVHISAITPLPKVANTAMKAHFEKLWDSATVLTARNGFSEEPAPVTDQEDEPERVDNGA